VVAEAVAEAEAEAAPGRSRLRRRLPALDCWLPARRGASLRIGRQAEHAVRADSVAVTAVVGPVLEEVLEFV
jgi:hypothetical protein